MKKFIFDLQRFAASYGDYAITIMSEGFEPGEPGVEYTASEDDLVSITTPKTAGGSVTVINDYNFSVDGHEVKIGNIAAGSPVKFTYGEGGTIELDLSDLTAESGETIYVISAGDAVKLTPPTDSDGDGNFGSFTYNYALGSLSDAYFKLNNKGTVTAFVADVAGESSGCRL